MEKQLLRSLALCLGLGGAAVAIEAEAKQCIWNKGAFALKVEWYPPKQVHYMAEAGRGASIDVQGKPVQTDAFPAAQGRCTNTDQALTAVVYVEGALLNSNYHAHGIQVMHGYADHMATIPCAAARCEARVTMNNGFYGVFLVITPPTDRYIDFSGTTFDPKFGPGGPITK